jgi:Tfp pilus assembly protein PilN
MMLRTNLSTRPFYNERAVVVLLVLVALIVGTGTVWTVMRLASLTSRHAILRAELAQAERRATDLRQQAARVRAGIDPKRLETVSNAALEANRIIDRRTFSWTELFNRFEATLPPDVRIKGVVPSEGANGEFVITMTVLAQRVNDVDAFIEALERTGAFTKVLSTDERTDEEGLLEATLVGTYLPEAGERTTGNTRR